MGKVTTTTVWKKNDLPKLKDALREAKSLYVAIGVNQNEGQEKKDGAEGLSVADVATFHEFGTVNVPERSFIRSNDAKNKGKYKLVLAEIAQKISTLKLSARQGFGLLGEVVLKDMKAGIVSGIKPDLDPKTIAAKGSSTPLIDTGQLLNSLTYKVDKK